MIFYNYVVNKSRQFFIVATIFSVVVVPGMMIANTQASTNPHPKCQTTQMNTNFGQYDSIGVNHMHANRAANELAQHCHYASSAITPNKTYHHVTHTKKTVKTHKKKKAYGFLHYNLYNDISGGGKATNLSQPSDDVQANVAVQLPVYGLIPGGKPLGAGKYKDSVMLTVTF